MNMKKSIFIILLILLIPYIGNRQLYINTIEGFPEMREPKNNYISLIINSSIWKFNSSDFNFKNTKISKIDFFEKVPTDPGIFPSIVIDSYQISWIGISDVKFIDGVDSIWYREYKIWGVFTWFTIHREITGIA